MQKYHHRHYCDPPSSSSSSSSSTSSSPSILTWPNCSYQKATPSFDFKKKIVVVVVRGGGGGVVVVVVVVVVVMVVLQPTYRYPFPIILKGSLAGLHEGRWGGNKHLPGRCSMSPTSARMVLLPRWSQWTFPGALISVHSTSIRPRR